MATLFAAAFTEARVGMLMVRGRSIVRANHAIAAPPTRTGGSSRPAAAS